MRSLGVSKCAIGPDLPLCHAISPTDRFHLRRAMVRR
jgi:hypothetical protein